jgi:hypothetical protein
MTRTLLGGACALLAITCSHAVNAQEDNEIIVEQTLLKPAAGLMNDHLHEAGEAMIGLRFERQHFGGINQSGTDRIADADVLAAGYTARASAMTMDMVMLDLMLGVTDDITVMVMPHYMWHRMDMLGIDPANTGMGGGHAGHGAGLPFGETHPHGTQGFGDTLVSASYRLARGHAFNAHATVGVWVPTGSVTRKNADGSFVHYGMQSGSGTWDVEPSITVSGQAGLFGWGAQAGYRWRSESANKSGFAFGDKARASAWGSRLLSRDVGATARLSWEHEGAIEGHYAGAHGHAAPPDRQRNYGGDVVSAAIGLNWLMPVGSAKRPQLGVELGVPLYQDLNGIQVPRKWSASVSLSKAF